VGLPFIELIAELNAGHPRRCTRLPRFNEAKYSAPSGWKDLQLKNVKLASCMLAGVVLAAAILAGCVTKGAPARHHRLRLLARQPSLPAGPSCRNGMQTT
jgi:hypothetical protein